MRLPRSLGALAAGLLALQCAETSPTEPALELPLCANARATAEGGAPVATLEVHADGRVLAAGVVVFTPGAEETFERDARAAIESWLAAAAAEVPEEDRVVLVRADRAVDFELPQAVLSACERDSVRTRRIRLAVRQADGSAGHFRVFLPAGSQESMIQLDPLFIPGTFKSGLLRLRMSPRALPTGAGWDPEQVDYHLSGGFRAEDLPGVVARVERILEYIERTGEEGEPLNLLLDVRRHVRWGKVAEVLDALAALGIHDVWFDDL